MQLTPKALYKTANNHKRVISKLFLPNCLSQTETIKSMRESLKVKTSNVLIFWLKSQLMSDFAKNLLRPLDFSAEGPKTGKKARAQVHAYLVQNSEKSIKNGNNLRK